MIKKETLVRPTAHHMYIPCSLPASDIWDPPRGDVVDVSPFVLVQAECELAKEMPVTDGPPTGCCLISAVNLSS